MLFESSFGDLPKSSKPGQGQGSPPEVNVERLLAGRERDVERGLVDEAGAHLELVPPLAEREVVTELVLVLLRRLRGVDRLADGHAVRVLLGGQRRVLTDVVQEVRIL